MVSKIVCLVEISNFVDNHEAEFSMVTEILAKLTFSIFRHILVAKGCRG